MNVKIIVETRSQMKQMVEQLRASTDQCKIIDPGRRGRWRMIFGTLGEVRNEGQEDQDPVFINTRDISEEGLGFVTHQQLLPDQQIIVNIETDEGIIEVAATVVHCTRTLGGTSKVGVRFNLADI